MRGRDDPALVGRACLCEQYELRITQRCLTEDLGHDADTAFSDALAHEIVLAFRREREAVPIGADTVGPHAGERTLHTLRRGDDHRGATWFDEEHGVVWLCAYGLHRSGARDDAFQHFKQLVVDQRIRPTAEDYEALILDREQRFADTIRLRAPILLERARAHPEEEIAETIEDVQVAVVLVVIETLQETLVALIGPNGPLSRSQTLLILKAFYPESEIGEWSVRYALPGRELDTSQLEICWAILHGVG